ncbi:hypothetical protein JHK84_049874 [Glycine max]|nr:hypothetical protein JHK86_049827 [Glycine max]KAG5094286.1 hypothetical protein JHK84_049874 [Glycine max]
MGGSCSRAWPARSYLCLLANNPEGVVSSGISCIGFSISSLVVMMRYLVPAD